MRTLTLNNNISVSTEQILNCQNQLGIKFPEIYVEFLIVNNGENLVECNYVKEVDWILSINFLYSVSNSIESSLLDIAQMYYDKFMSKHFLPFGDDGDWIFVISLRKEDYNSVYLYRTDEMEDDCLIYLEKSLENLVNQLQSKST